MYISYSLNTHIKYAFFYFPLQIVTSLENFKKYKVIVLVLHTYDLHLNFLVPKNPYLSMFIQNLSEEAIFVRESLGASALAHAHNPMLGRMQYTTLKKQGGKFLYYVGKT